MPRLTATQASALADWWNLAYDAASARLGSPVLLEAAASIAQDAGRSLAFAESTAIVQLYAIASRMVSAANEVQSALTTDIITADHIAVPPWARDEQAMNTAPIWHVIYEFSYIDANGVAQTDHRTSVFDMIFPEDIGSLTDDVTGDAQALASKYRVTFTGISLVSILAVLPMRTVPIHNLRPNEVVWTPPAVAFFDTETRWTGDDESETHTLRCWSARLDVRRHRRIRPFDIERVQGTDAAGLADILDDWAVFHPTLWIYAHNLAFDLTTSGVTALLAERGWQVTEFAVDSSSPFVRMTNGRSRITFADSFSWLPLSLDEVAVKMGGSKVPLPPNDGELSEWLRRCAGDVDLLAQAMLSIMAWWDSAGLGKWSVTGSASGWNAMRHKIDARRFTINPDPAGIAADRAAVYGGRRGLWRHGSLPSGNYAELDFTGAYPTVAASLPLPLERMAAFGSLPLDHPWLTSQRHGVIARVRLDTGRALWPVRIDGKVWYPAGELWTTLAAPDIAEALRHGVLCEIGAGYVHRLGYALKPWADWCLSTGRGEAVDAPPAIALWAKHCGRAVIGKWAQRGYQTIPLGPAPTRGWWASEGWNHTAGVRATIIDFDGRRWQASAAGDGDNCYPAVLAWVESYVRVRLGRLIDSLPSAAMVACDTDGTIIDLRQMGNWESDSEALWPLQPRIKNRYIHAEITGPQHMTLDGINRMAGIPSSARRLPDGRLTAMLWPKLTWQMANSQQGVYVRPNQSYRTASTYAPGWINSFERVLPIQTEIDAQGNTVIVPWPQTWYARQGMQLAETQNAALERYRHGKETISRRESQEANASG